jgi:hypothetical protein
MLASLHADSFVEGARMTEMIKSSVGTEHGDAKHMTNASNERKHSPQTRLKPEEKGGSGSSKLGSWCCAGVSAPRLPRPAWSAARRADHSELINEVRMSSRVLEDSIQQQSNA